MQDLSVTGVHVVFRKYFSGAAYSWTIVLLLFSDHPDISALVDWA